ncbi:PCI domain-containing protein [Aphelenchoides fujianensis]|nr:PCI domain-containing protein [Aphelenchoides fujianensis]KAI6225333.1 PCI domain-containing protein [Aphelenchoides fujianensis]
MDLSDIPVPSDAQGGSNGHAVGAPNEFWARAQSNLQQLRPAPPPEPPSVFPAAFPPQSFGVPGAFFPPSFVPPFGAQFPPRGPPLAMPTGVTAAHRLAAMRRGRDMGPGARPPRITPPPYHQRPANNFNYRNVPPPRPSAFRPSAPGPFRPPVRPPPAPSVKVAGNNGTFVYSDFFNRLIPESVKEYCDRSYDTLPSESMKDQLEFYLKERITPLLDSGAAARVNWSAEPMPHKNNFQLSNAWIPAAKLRGDSSKSPPPSQRKRNFNDSHDSSRSRFDENKRSKWDPPSRKPEVQPVIPISNYNAKQNQKKNVEKNAAEHGAGPKGKKRKGIGFIGDDEQHSEERRRLREMRFSENAPGSSTGARNAGSSSFGRPQVSCSTSGGRSNFKQMIEKCSLKRRRRIVGTCLQVEKPYFRLTAAADPSQVRPLHVLEKSLKAVRKRYEEKGDYTYANDQLKSIRQDILTQDIRNDFAIEVYEEHVLLAIKHKDREEFNQSQQQLKNLYENEKKSRNRLKFTAYRLLYYVYVEGESDATELLRKFKDEVSASEELALARKVYLAYTTRDYTTILRLYSEASGVFREVMDFFIERERNRYFQCILSAYRPNLAGAGLCKMLHIAEGELAEYLKKFGITMDGDVLDMRRWGNMNILGTSSAS